MAACLTDAFAVALDWTLRMVGLHRVRAIRTKPTLKASWTLKITMAIMRLLNVIRSLRDDIVGVPSFEDSSTDASLQGTSSIRQGLKCQCPAELTGKCCAEPRSRSVVVSGLTPSPLGMRG